MMPLGRTGLEPCFETLVRAKAFMLFSAGHVLFSVFTSFNQAELVKQTG
jgi:hypothetical protein